MRVRKKVFLTELLDMRLSHRRSKCQVLFVASQLVYYLYCKAVLMMNSIEIAVPSIQQAFSLSLRSPVGLTNLNTTLHIKRCPWSQSDSVFKTCGILEGIPVLV